MRKEFCKDLRGSLALATLLWQHFIWNSKAHEFVYDPVFDELVTLNGNELSDECTGILLFITPAKGNSNPSPHMHP
jgi:hypothetical protein